MPCLLPLLVTCTALAQAPPAATAPVSLHAGLPVAELQALHLQEGEDAQPPSFGTSTTGFSLIVPEGIVFVYVAPSVDEAQAWTELQLSRQRQAPVPVEQPVDGVEAAWRSGTSFYMLRDDNIGLMVQGTAEASEEASLVRGLIHQGEVPWSQPVAPLLQPDGSWTVDAPDALHVAWQGGRRLPGPGLRFADPPLKLVTWDPLGRAAVWWRDGAPPPAPTARE